MFPTFIGDGPHLISWNLLTPLTEQGSGTKSDAEEAAMRMEAKTIEVHLRDDSRISIVPGELR